MDWEAVATPGGKRFRQSLGTTDKRQAQELHDKLKAEMWRTEKLGDAPVKYFEEACLRWLNEKADKKCLNADKSKIGFFLMHLKGREIGSISNDEIQTLVSGMTNRKHLANWTQMKERLELEGTPVPPYKPNQFPNPHDILIRPSCAHFCALRLTSGDGSIRYR